jgi:glucokinase
MLHIAETWFLNPYFIEENAGKQRMNGKSFSIGIDLGGTNIKFCIADEFGEIRARHRIATPTSAGCDGIIDAIVASIPVLLQKADLQLAQIDGIGLGVPGSVDPEQGIIVFAPNIFAVNVEAAKAIQKHIDVPVYLAQDSQAAAWAEYLVGAGRGLPSVVTVTLGTGIGCGMVLNGKIYRGSLNHTAGELGHQIVEFEGNECNCGRRGCLEAYAAGLAVVRAAIETIPELESLLGRSAQSVSVKDVFDLALKGNQQARQITSSVVKYLGLGLVSLVNLLSPALITLSGGISDAPAELLFDPLVEFVRRNAYPTISDATQICRSPLGSDAPLIGVAILHRQSHLVGSRSALTTGNRVKYA